jgi:uncharacterized membrane protein
VLWPKPWTDQQMDVTIAIILRAGVIVSALTVLMGGVFYLSRYGFTLPNYRVFLGEPADLRSISGIISDALALRPRGIIQFGLLLLIATPIVRVAFAVAAFALQRDRVYVMVTLIVLGVLLYSLLGGGG